MKGSPHPNTTNERFVNEGGGPRGGCGVCLGRSDFRKYFSSKVSDKNRKEVTTILKKIQSVTQ